MADKAPKLTKAGKPHKPRSGRPTKPLNWKTIDSMLKIQCTEKEIASICDCSVDHLTDKCLEKFGKTFSAYGAEKREGGKMSLRRKMYHRAQKDGSDTMLIWLAKNHLGMSDKQQINADIHSVEEIKITFASLQMPIPGIPTT